MEWQQKNAIEFSRCAEEINFLENIKGVLHYGEAPFLLRLMTLSLRVRYFLGNSIP